MNLSNGKFWFATRTRVDYGSGVHKEVGNLAKKLGCTKALLVTDANLSKIGMADQIASLLREQGVATEIFDRVDAEPTVEHVEAGVAFLKAAGSDIVVALGGGSAMDCAKIVNVMAENPGHLVDYEGLPTRFLHDSPRPLIALPTTSGTGAETAGWVSIADPARNYKMGMASEYNEPEFALVDPVLTLDLPPRATAYSGVDALSQAIESMLHRRRSPMSIALGLHAVRLASENLATAVTHGWDLEARANMSYASLLAGYAKRLGGCIVGHNIANTVGGLYHVAHGLIVGVVLPHILQFCLPGDVEMLADIARAMGVESAGYSDRETAELGIAAINQLLEDIEIPTLSELGIQEKDLPEIAKQTLSDSGVAGNPRPLTVQGVEGILRAALADTHANRARR